SVSMREREALAASAFKQELPSPARRRVWSAIGGAGQHSRAALHRLFAGCRHTNRSLRFGCRFDPDPFHAPRIGVDNLNVKTGGMTEDFTPLRQPRRKRDR